MSTPETSAIVNTSSMSSSFSVSSSSSSSSSSSTNHPIVDANANNVAVSVLGAMSNTTSSSSSSSSSSSILQSVPKLAIGNVLGYIEIPFTLSYRPPYQVTEHDIIDNEHEFKSFLLEKQISDTDERLTRLSSLINFVTNSILLIHKVKFSEFEYISQTNLENQSLVVYFSRNLEHPHKPPKEERRYHPWSGEPITRIAFILLNIPKTIMNSIKLVNLGDKEITETHEMTLYQTLKKQNPSKNRELIHAIVMKSLLMPGQQRPPGEIYERGIVNPFVSRISLLLSLPDDLRPWFNGLCLKEQSVLTEQMRINSQNDKIWAELQAIYESRKIPTLYESRPALDFLHNESFG